ncbi:HAUS augmin-like complex subunit 3 [Apis cerana]|uniref:HAUS augmin complex subunit n=1 Tax=Apis cerana cerana TaxID=94128 RepID=A0A2A3E9W7_APICC|nr:HAUS augmin-like complex subunit 3 [Apis cerana]PBC28510.1 HAUS augmin complex subunit [Apis cerana cerana]
MDISGKILYDKVRGLRSELSNVVTPDLLDQICDNPSVQPFLKWFCENVNYVNVLSDEDIQIKNKLQETNEWLEDSELDHSLEEITKNYPDLLKIISFDDTDINDLFAEFEILKDSYKEDENYIHILQNGIQNLKKLEIELDNNIEQEKQLLDRENIEADKAYKECFVILKDFDVQNHKCFKEVEYLLNVYADAAENKGIPLLWTQMPLESFIKKIEMYSHYLDVHIKRQFENISENEQKIDSNYVSSINDNKEKDIDNRQELTLYKTKLTNAKIEEILAKIQEKSYIAMFDCIKNIYNLGNLKIPNQSELRTEIVKLTKKRDFLEEEILLQECQLSEIVQQFSELEITKVLKQDAHIRLEQTKNHLQKLKNLQFFAREHGHVHTDLLRILMEMQFHCLKNVSEFVADVYHYLKTEYLLSFTRCESMQQQQNEYSATILSSSKLHNSFHKLFISMLCNNDNIHQLNPVLDKYNDLIDENKTKKQFILKTYLNSKIQRLEILENEINLQYLNEIQKGSTHTFKPITYEIETCYDETFDNLQKIQNDLLKIRNQMTERRKADIGFEREKNILWQRFLVDPDTLRKIYKEMKSMGNKSCFSD